MCDCCIQESLADQLAEPAVWFPVAAAIGAFFLQLWIRTVRKRKEDSSIAALYLHEIAKEVEVGIERLEYLYTHSGQPYTSGDYRPIMPTQNWIGVRDIFPDDVLRRLINVARHSGNESQFDDLRFHLKNYYTVVCKFGNDVILGKAPFDRATARVDLDGARGVLRLLGKAEHVVKENASRIIWPW